MSKTLKWILLAAAAVTCLGLILACAGIFLFGGLTDSEHFQTFTRTYPSDITSIDAKLDVGDIRVASGTGDEIVVSYADNEDHYFTLESQGGTLFITRKDPRPWYLCFNFSLSGGPKYDLEILIPESYEGGLTLATATGNMDIEDVEIRSDMEVDASTGNIKARDVLCAGSFKAEVVTGDIRLQTVEAGGRILTRVKGAGRVTGEAVSCGGAFTAELTTGDVELDGLEAASVDIQVSTGDVEIFELAAAESVRIEVTTGDVLCEAIGKMENYDITCDTVTGRSNLPERAAYGEIPLRVHTTTGNIDFSFKQ